MQVYSFSFKRLRNGTQQRLLFVDKHACISLPILRKLEAYCSSPCFDLDRYQDTGIKRGLPKCTEVSIKNQ